MAEAFLSIGDFTSEYQGRLTGGQTATATRLLEVASDHIRSLKSDVNESTAAQVVFEVVRDAITFGALERFSSFQNITGRRQESGTFDEAKKVIDGYLTKQQRQLLGIFTRPAYYFGD